MAEPSHSSASYIHMVQHLIEKCLIFHMSKEECMEALSKHANIKPVITSTGIIFSSLFVPTFSSLIIITYALQTRFCTISTPYKIKDIHDQIISKCKITFNTCINEPLLIG
ncbi:hypothetical protein VIGAN_04018600 [Vigna angularis var. angularis]|uniref:Uncharacterized protein n=1 Tax=Vigna angularis var. angularis TaxID=157739 RepID=A0A0S3RR73_PHAAN|nr:hypothetical protein VIGAN_04018600 [Vigna angularis var. angularis]